MKPKTKVLQYEGFPFETASKLTTIVKYSICMLKKTDDTHIIHILAGSKWVKKQKG